ncbi:MAG TPA: hypothetical protein VFR24_00130 [Candidatus Angelobacter sp.]|nr:hypothetical protein [Candidatus Angelobacter sp.]
MARKNHYTKRALEIYGIKTPKSKVITEHTPGPWVSNWSTRTNNELKRGWFVESELPSDSDTYGVIAELPDGRENTEANARLIAAAPELLAEAKELLRNARFEDGQGIILTQDAEALEAAIAKAEGK